MARVIFFLIDGLSDRIRSKTPLRLAKKKNIDNLLKNSFLAQFLPLKKWPKIGRASVSGLANLGILDYALSPIKLKRGPLEAIGSDINYKNGELALRVDFATVDKNLNVIDRRAGRNYFGLDELARVVNSSIFSIPFNFHRTYGHRGVLIFHQQLSPFISDSDPLKIKTKVKKIKALKNDNLSKKTAQILQEFLDKTHCILNFHPINILREKQGFLKANYLLTREAGNFLPKLKNFFKKTKFRNGLVIAENGVVKGGCLLVGFKAITLPEIEDIKKRYLFLKEKILENFRKYDLIYLHLKEADEASHDKNFEKKKYFFEFFDKWFGDLTKNLPKNLTYIITGDHITDTRVGKHLSGPVPILIINFKNPNFPQEFSEIEAKKKKNIIEPKSLWRMLV